jgi:hypothetical protein
VTGPRRWYPDDGDYRLIWEHLTRQADLDPRRLVRLDDGRVVGVGSDAMGEADDDRR